MLLKFFLAQVVLILALVCGWGAINDKVIPSILYGGLSCLVPNLYFAYRFFSGKHQKRPMQILITFYVGELVKMVLASGMVVLAVLYANAYVLPTVLGYFVANLAFWLAPLIRLKEQQQQQG